MMKTKASGQHKMIAIFAIILCLHLMLHGSRPLISLYAKSLNAQPFEIGLIAAIFSFLPLILAIKIGKISDKIGNRLPIIGGTIFIFISLLILYLFPFKLTLYFSQIFSGMAQLLLHLGLQNEISFEKDTSKKIMYFGLLSTFMSVGQLVGPLLGSMLAEWQTYQFAFLFLSLIGIGPIFISFIFKNKPAPKMDEAIISTSLLDTFKLFQYPMLSYSLIASTIILSAKDLYIYFFPLYANDKGISLSAIGIILTIQSLAMVLIRLFMTKIVSKFNIARIVIITIMLVGVMFILVPISAEVMYLCVLAIVMGAGIGITQPLTMVLTNNYSPKGREGEVIGLRLMFNRLALTGLPIGAGAIAVFTSYSIIFILIGISLVAAPLYLRGERNM